MVFKHRFFSSKKSDSSNSSSDASSRKNSPKPFVSRSRNNNSKFSANKPLAGAFAAGGPSRRTPLNGEVRNKDVVKGKEIQNQVPESCPKTLASAVVAEGKPFSPLSSASPIMASSLGLSKIKTRSAPLSLECFLDFSGDNKLDGNDVTKNGSSDGEKKKENRVWFQENGASVDNGDRMSIASALSRERSPAVSVKSPPRNEESDSEAGWTIKWSELGIMPKRKRCLKNKFCIMEDRVLLKINSASTIYILFIAFITYMIIQVDVTHNLSP